MKVLVLFIFVLAPLWVCEAKLNIQGLASGLRAILGSVSKTVVKKTIKEIGSKSLKEIEESFTRKLSLKQKDKDGQWLPYFNAWYVFCDGVICSN